MGRLSRRALGGGASSAAVAGADAGCPPALAQPTQAVPARCRAPRGRAPSSAARSAASSATTRRAAAGRDGVGARRDDGDDGHRRARPLLARHAARRRLHAARAPGRLRRVAARERAGRPAARRVYRLQLRRLDAPVATTGAHAEHADGRPIVAAGFGLPQVESADAEPTADEDDHPHTETAWRLRHLTRSILKDSANAVGLSPTTTPRSRRPSRCSAARSCRRRRWPRRSSPTCRSSGEVNLLTTGAFAPGELFAGDGLPRGVAYLAIGAPTPAGDWAVRAAMSEGDLSSWIVAGSFVSKRGPAALLRPRAVVQHAGVSGRQPARARGGERRQPQRRRDLRARSLDRRRPACPFEYGARYARYDYLAQPGLVQPARRLHARARQGHARDGRRSRSGWSRRAPKSSCRPAIAGAVAAARADVLAARRRRDLRVERARYLDVLSSTSSTAPTSSASAASSRASTTS